MYFVEGYCLSDVIWTCMTAIMCTTRMYIHVIIFEQAKYAESGAKCAARPEVSDPGQRGGYCCGGWHDKCGKHPSVGGLGACCIPEN